MKTSKKQSEFSAFIKIILIAYLQLKESRGNIVNELKIRDDKVSLNGEELKTLTKFEIKSPRRARKE